MILRLQVSFDLDLDDPEVCRAIDAQFVKAWRNMKTSLRTELIAAKSQISEMTLEMRDELVARGVLSLPPVAPYVPDQGSAPTS